MEAIHMKRIFTIGALAIILAAGTVTMIIINAQPALACVQPSC
jgi:hypothetical protein